VKKKKKGEGVFDLPASSPTSTGLPTADKSGSLLCRLGFLPPNPHPPLADSVVTAWLVVDGGQLGAVPVAVPLMVLFLHSIESHIANVLVSNIRARVLLFHCAVEYL
jgi:hypothetical protein